MVRCIISKRVVLTVKKCASTVGDQIILLVEGLSDGGHEQLAEIVIIIKGVRLVFVLSYDYFSKEEMNEDNKHVIDDNKFVIHGHSQPVDGT